MKYSYKDQGFKICGIPYYEKHGEFRRLNDRLTSLYPHLKDGDKRPVGARLRFATNSKVVKIHIDVENVYPDRGMSFYQANLANAFAEKDGIKRNIGIISSPRAYEDNYLEAEFSLSGEKEEITVFLPRNPSVTNIEISIDDDAQIFEPRNYTYGKPIVFYGSSITENGHTSSCNSYSALLSKWIDFDYYNFGFSGAARGDIELTEWFSGIDFSVFIMDYDHNAPNAEHLQSTHFPFYQRMRELNPGKPILMLSAPDRSFEDWEARRAIIAETFKKAKDAGDNDIYFIDGQSYFENTDREICTTDLTHPNDLGHYLMAKKIEPLLRELLNQTEG